MASRDRAEKAKGNAGRRASRRSGDQDPIGRPSRQELRQAFDDLIGAAFEQLDPDLSDEEVREMVAETFMRKPLGGTMTTDEIMEAGEEVEAVEVRRRGGRRRGRGPGPWVSVADAIPEAKARIWRDLRREDAAQAQNNINSKRRRDGRTETGRWVWPRFANIDPEPRGGGYSLTIAHDPDREVHDALE